MADVSQARQRRFDGKAFALAGGFGDFFQHQPTGFQCRFFRGEGGQPGGNQICVDEAQHACLCRQKTAGKRRLAGPVGASDDDRLLSEGGFCFHDASRLCMGVYRLRRPGWMVHAPVCMVLVAGPKTGYIWSC